VNYCEEQNLFDETIYTHFLMSVNLGNTYAGYLSDTSKRFTQVVDKFSPKVEYCVFSNIEYVPEYEKLKRWHNLKLVKKISNNLAWAELYKVNPMSAEQDSLLSVRHGKLVKKYIQQIKEKEEWLESIRIKAANKNISVDSMMMLDAIFMADQALGKQK
jgi:hypothetical protein